MLLELLWVSVLPMRVSESGVVTYLPIGKSFAKKILEH